ncbi:MAG: DNA recombination protein RmuC [Acidobacteriaceae bacterium]
MSISSVLLLALGIAIGSIVSWGWLRSRLGGLAARCSEYERTNSGLAARQTELQLKIDATQSAAVRSQMEAVAATERHRAAAQRLQQTEDHLRELEEDVRTERDRASANHAELQRVLTTLKEKQESHLRELAAYQQAEQRLKDTFQSLAADALKGSTDEFLKLAEARLSEREKSSEVELEMRKQQVEHLVKPLAESLGKFNDKVQEIETKREGAYSEIKAQIESLRLTGDQMRSEASRLVNALKMPQQRGRWGEIQMRRVVELAGMVRYCDFDEQVGVRDCDRNLLRPDMTVRLPNRRTIVVDSKVALSAYLEAAASDDEAQRASKLKEHALQIRAHLTRLASKSYWSQFDQSPEFVIAFVPGEAFFSAALQQDPSLIEFGAENKVVLATPTTLIALLKAVAYGWRQEDVARNAQQISELGKQLYDRISTMYSYVSDLGNSLDKSVRHYNKVIGAMESRVIVGARKFKELGATNAEDIPEVAPLDSAPRELSPANLFHLHAVAASASIEEN